MACDGDALSKWKKKKEEGLKLLYTLVKKTSFD